MWTCVVGAAKLGQVADAFMSSDALDRSPCTLSVLRARLKKLAAVLRLSAPDTFIILQGDTHSAQLPPGGAAGVYPAVADAVTLDMVTADTEDGSAEGWGEVVSLLDNPILLADRVAGGTWEMLLTTLSCYTFPGIPTTIMQTPAAQAAESFRLLWTARLDPWLTTHMTGSAGINATAARLQSAVKAGASVGASDAIPLALLQAHPLAALLSG